MRADVADMGSDPANAWRLVLRLGAATQTYITQLRHALGLTSSELQAVLALWDGGRCTMTELGHRIDMSRAAITTLADRVEKAGYIQRFPDPTDRRRIFLGVTRKAEAELSAQLEGLRDALAGHTDTNDEGWPAFATHAAAVRALLLDQADALRARGQRHPRSGRTRDVSVQEPDPATFW